MCGPVFQDSPRVFNYVLIVITSESSPKARQLKNNTFAKNLMSSAILLSMATLANFCELDRNRIFSREEKTALPGLGPGEAAGASLDLQTAKACLFVHLSGIRSPACCFWVGRCVIS